MSDIDNAISQGDLIEIAEKFGARLTKYRNEFRGPCPIHQGKNPTSFVIYEDGGKQRWRCWSDCNDGGDVIDFVMKIRGCDLKSAVEFITGGKSLSHDELQKISAERVQAAKENERKKWQEYQHALDELRRAETWKRYYDTLMDDQKARQAWQARGVPDNWQEVWTLGYCYDFTFKAYDDTLHTSPTLTIPIFNSQNKLVNVKHRLLSPTDPKDKYRPEKPGLRQMPFLAHPEHGYELDKIFIVEGEIKAMVTCITLDDSKVQIIGIPGKKTLHMLKDLLDGHSVWICPDRDARQETIEFAKQIKARMIDIPIKIDDAINSGCINENGIKRLMHDAKQY